MTASDPRSLTTEQASVVAHTTSSVALRAGAGTGKTRVLAEKFLSLLAGPDRVPLGHLVALTFTEKAARELRGRVRETCRLQLQSATADWSYWRAILVGLEAAPIGTFHAFCGQVLQRFAIEAGIEPGFRVLDEPMAEALREESLRTSVLTWLGQSDEDFITRALELGVAPARDIVDDLIADRTQLDLSAWLERTPEEIVHAWSTYLTETAWPAFARDVLREARPLLGLLSTPVSTRPIMRQRSNYLIEELPQIVSHAEAGERIAEIIKHARIQGAAKETFESDECYEKVKEGLARLRDRLKDSQKLLEWDEPAALRAAAACGNWARLAQSAITAYQRAKQARGALDFNDLQQRTLDLLESCPKAVRAWLEGEIAHVLVDEFQDTDPIQSAIIRHLTGATWSEDKLFVVGDPKQSIYGFRGARPELFDSYRAELPPEGRYQLTGNFRGVPELINFTNDLFHGVFEEDTPALSPGRPELRDPSRTAVEFLWAGDDERHPNEKWLVPERRRTEARWIARWIHANLNSKWIVRDEELGTERPARPRDVVLLFRTLNDSALYESALAEVGLDYYVVGGKSFYGQQEVLDLINLLTVLNDPHDALALAATLRGPFGCVSDEALYWLAKAGAGDLVRGFPEWGGISELAEDDRARLGRIHDLLSRWGADKDRITAAELVERVLAESGFEAALMGEFLGERRLANVRKLARMARGFEGDGRLSVADFVAWLRAKWSKPPREEQATTTDEQAEAVRLMTIHQAKGLEFPIVVVVDLDRKSSEPVTSGVAAGPSDLGIVVKSSGDDDSGENLGWLLHKEQASRARKAEDLRLFYVAVTRARDRLILSAGLDVDEPPKSTALELLFERFDRATGARLDGGASGSEPPRVRVITEAPPGVARRRRAAFRPRPRRFARIISLAPIHNKESLHDESSAIPAIRSLPRHLDLTLDHGSNAHASRVDRLFRALLADPSASDPARRVRSARALARRQIPIASKAIEDEALQRVEAWSRTSLAEQAACAAEVVRDVEWVHAVTDESGHETVLRGSLDLAFRTADQGWTLVVHAHEEAEADRERARLLGSVLAATSLGLDPVAGAWLVRSGAGPERTADRDLRGDAAALRLRALLSGASV